LGHLGDQAAAQTALKELMEIKPAFTVDFAKERLFYIKLPIRWRHIWMAYERRALNSSSTEWHFRCWHETDMPPWSLYVCCWGDTVAKVFFG
jgi:hypothetical protein